jgi:streptogramin lyase/outer membrane protein assembly factor BamB
MNLRNLFRILPGYAELKIDDKMKNLTAILFTGLSTLTMVTGQAQSIADNWHQWRGPENSGVSRTAKPPLKWSEGKNLKWKAEIQGHGTSSPIVFGDRVFVTTAINTGNVDPKLPKPEDQPERVFGIKHPNTSYEMVLLCFDRKTGDRLWREVAKTIVPHEGHHKDASFASASPFCDGERVYFWFGSAGMFAYSLDGKKVWERDLGPAKVGASLGEGSSPVVHDGKLIIVRDHSGQSTIECLDAASGKTIWKKDRDEGNAWATPAIAKHDDMTQVITTASNQVCSYNLENGEVIWSATGLTNNSTPCPIVEGNTVYCMTGYQGHALLAIPITETGDVTDKITWKADRGTPYVPSPILYDGQLYFTQSNQGILTSLQSKDGSEVIARTRVPDLGDIYASPVGADGRIYFVGRKGTTVVIESGKEFKVLATNQLEDNFHASPALAGNQLFLRGMRFLYCLENGGTANGKSAAAVLAKSAPTPVKKKAPADPKKALGDKLRQMVEAERITAEESIALYLTAFPEEEGNVKQWLAGLKAETELRQLLETIAKREIPKDYEGEKHQPFVDKWFASAAPEKANEVGMLWKEQRRLFPEMENRGESFIRILDYVRTKGNNKPTAPQPKRGNSHIKKKQKAEIRREAGTLTPGVKGTVAGSVRSQKGEPMGGVMVSAFDENNRQSISVFTQADGNFLIDRLHQADYRIRARLPGQRDHWVEDVKLGDDKVSVTMEPATGRELEEQRPASDAFAQLEFDSPRDRLNFKMMCSYCHQIGTPGFRTPEKPVDWETMITRMDGFGGLYPHTKETIVKRIIDTYKGNAVENWPEYVPPPAPTGMVAQAKITAWEMGEHYVGSFHDLEIGDDGLAYVVHIGKQYTATLDPKTGERIYYRLPRGSHGPHSIEPDNKGDMWLTLCVSGEMAKFDLETKEYTITSSAEAPAERGSWPHTLRVDPKDPEGYIWYTDAGRNSVFRQHPETLERKEYHLLDSNQVKAGGKGESRGITPYGLDYSPVDGTIWYSKLNGNRIGRIDPTTPDGAVTEWNPPFRGPRRLHVAPDGIVWVPGFGSGVFGKFDPKTEKWTTYPLPDYLNQIPYALNVAPDGIVWICGTGNDTLYRFNPETEYLVEFPLPYRVSYTREIEFDKEGNVWTSTSGPARHMENVCGTVIKLEIPADAEETGGMKLSPIELSLEEQGILSKADRKQRTNEKKSGESVAKLIQSGKFDAAPFDALKLALSQTNPQARGAALSAAFGRLGGGVGGAKLDEVVKRLNSMTNEQDKDFAINGLAHGMVSSDPEGALKWANSISQDGFRKVVVTNVTRQIEAHSSRSKKVAASKPAPKSMEKKIGVHRLDNESRSAFDAFVYVNRIPDQPRDDESAHQFAGRIHGRLANQEGRVLLKLPPGMDRAAYSGFKTFLGSEGNAKVTNCITCHSPPDFAISSGGTLRKGKWSAGEIEAILRGKMEKAKSGDAEYAGLKITDSDLPGLTAFLGNLSDSSDEAFRDLILSASVVDVTARKKSAPKTQGTVTTLSGNARYAGEQPELRRLPLDEASRKLYEGKPPLDENILISESGGLVNVFVYVKNPPVGNHPLPDKPAIIDQQKSVFRPRVQGIRVGQEVVMKNGDPFIHNIRSLSRKNRPFNIVQPAGTPDREKTFEIAEGPITIKCDFHRWMTAHFWVMDHPFYAVTDAKGQFTIPDLPPGEYQLAAWHEEFGKQELSVSVKKEGASKINFRFQAKN